MGMSSSTTTTTTATNAATKVVYLNNAGLAELTMKAKEAGQRAIMKHVWEPPNDNSIDAEKVRECFAKLIHCDDPLDIAMVNDTAFAISLAAFNIQRTMKSKHRTNGGRIILLQDQFPSAVYPWQQVCDESENNSIKLDIVPYPTNEKETWTSMILKRLNEDVVVACLPPLHWTDGTVIDLEAISTRCQQYDIPLIVDATQAVGIMECSVAKIKPVFLACSVHKWLRGPPGASLIYVSKSIQQSWIPINLHGRSRQQAKDKSWDATKNEMSPKGYPEQFVHNALKFNQGGRPNPIILPILRVGIEEVVQIMTMEDGTISFEEAQNQLRTTMEPLLHWAKNNGYVQNPGPQMSHIVGLRPCPTKHMTPRQLLDIATALQQRGIYLAVRCGGFRIAPYLDTTAEDIQSLIAALEELTP